MASIDPHELIADVEFAPGFDTDSLSYNPELSFLEVAEAETAINGLRLVGFGLPLSRFGGIHMGTGIRPITEFRELPHENRTVTQQGKGVGARMYNVPQALAGSWTVPDKVGVYTFDIDPSRLLDARAAQGSRVTRLVRHAGRITRAKLFGLDKLVESIHASYGDVDAVELEMPPLPELRQLGHGVHNPAGIKPQFIIIRNPNIILHRVGSSSAR